MIQKETYLVTGSAGFIGYHLSERLLSMGHHVVGFDNLNNYYDVNLKLARNDRLKKNERYQFIHDNLTNKPSIVSLFAKNKFKAVFHLGAQAGVRYSLEKPEVYVESNIHGTLNILEAARYSDSKPHLLLASSSSVYGLSRKFPFSEDDPADKPAAIYGASKRANELMGHSYAHLFGLRVTMLRFFSVYGTWGRPDMALFIFVKKILNNEPIELFNKGNMIRDFTYVDDIVEGMLALEKNRLNPELPMYDIFNIGCANPRNLTDFLALIEKNLNKKAQIVHAPFQPGDVQMTVADVTKLQNLTNYKPKINIEEGVANFVKWYLEFYGK
ncbi:MAG: GDP-mannose 4,6-dehydratase [Bacteriovoracia bacterium]